MTLIVCDAGEQLLLDRMFSLSTEENLVLKLYSNNYTPVDDSEAGDFTEATFTNYVAKTLTNASWDSATTSDGVASVQYGSIQTWTAGSSETIYGYYVVGATSGNLYWAERFAQAQALTSGVTLPVRPKFTGNTAS